MKKPIATAFRLKLNLNRIKDDEMRKTIEADIKQAHLFSGIYLAPSCPEIKMIENLGFRLPKKGEYYILTEY